MYFKGTSLVVTLVLENQTNLLVVMLIGHGKFTTFMMLPTVTNHIVIMVVHLSILVSGHQVDAQLLNLHHSTFGVDAITLDDPLTIVFVLVKYATTPRFVQLAHTLNHLQKLHCIVVDEVHLLLSDFKPIMK